MQIHDKISISGKWVPAYSTGTIDVINAATEEVMGKAPAGTIEGYKQSGHGRELGRHGLEEFLEIISLQLPQ